MIWLTSTVSRRQGALAVLKGMRRSPGRRFLKGISYSVGKSASRYMRELRQADFDPKEKFWTRFPPPSHQSLEFRWKDYCPMVFRSNLTPMMVIGRTLEEHTIYL